MSGLVTRLVTRKDDPAAPFRRAAGVGGGVGGAYVCKKGAGQEKHATLCRGGSDDSAGMPVLRRARVQWVFCPEVASHPPKLGMPRSRAC